jgi:hypothetical protein
MYVDFFLSKTSNDFPSGLIYFLSAGVYFL